MKQWKISSNGQDHIVTFTPGHGSEKPALCVDDAKVPLEKTSFIKCLDQAVTVGEKQCRFVLIGKKADLAVDGRYLDSGQPYVASHGTPWWAWIFTILCAAIPMISLGGAVPAVIGVLGVMSCLRISVSPFRKTTAKVFACLGITLLAWLIWVAFLMLLNGSAA